MSDAKKRGHFTRTWKYLVCINHKLLLWFILTSISPKRSVLFTSSYGKKARIFLFPFFYIVTWITAVNLLPAIARAFYGNIKLAIQAAIPSAKVQIVYVGRHAFFIRVRIANKHFWQKHLLAPSFIIGVPSGIARVGRGIPPGIARVCGLCSSVRIVVAFVFLGRGPNLPPIKVNWDIRQLRRNNKT